MSNQNEFNIKTSASRATRSRRTTASTVARISLFTILGVAGVVTTFYLLTTMYQSKKKEDYKVGVITEGQKLQEKVTAELERIRNGN